MTRWLLLLAVLAAPASALADPTTEISALPDPGSELWDERVQELLLSVYDRDDSLKIDSTEELLILPCNLLRALDDAVRSAWGKGLRTTYGLRADKRWVGGVLGFDPAVRSGVDLRFASCLEQAGDSLPLADRLRQLPGGGSSSWDAAVESLLVESFDADHSGSLDTPQEIDSIPCATWSAIDSGVRVNWNGGLGMIYGFEADKVWIGHLLGFNEQTRQQAAQRLSSCLASPRESVPLPPSAEQGLGGAGSPAAAIRGFPGGGTDPWDKRVQALLLREFDTDGSGWLDSAEEVALPCPVWGAMDQGVSEHFGYGLGPIYGFSLRLFLGRRCPGLPRRSAIPRRPCAAELRS